MKPKMFTKFATSARYNDDGTTASLTLMITFQHAHANKNQYDCLISATARQRGGGKPPIRPEAHCSAKVHAKDDTNDERGGVNGGGDDPMNLLRTTTTATTATTHQTAIRNETTTVTTGRSVVDRNNNDSQRRPNTESTATSTQVHTRHAAKSAQSSARFVLVWWLMRCCARDGFRSEAHTRVAHSHTKL